MTQRLLAGPELEADIASSFAWYEQEQPGLGEEFLSELHHAFDRVAAAPLNYRDIGSSIRRVLLRRFPYAAYFAVEGEDIVVLAVLHASRDPAEWQRRR